MQASEETAGSYLQKPPRWRKSTEAEKFCFRRRIKGEIPCDPEVLWLVWSPVCWENMALFASLYRKGKLSYSWIFVRCSEMQSWDENRESLSQFPKTHTKSQFVIQGFTFVRIRQPQVLASRRWALIRRANFQSNRRSLSASYYMDISGY